MIGYRPQDSFGPDVAGQYKNVLRGDEVAAVECLASLAQGGPVLELAIGAGRLALPLSARGMVVDGIDFSPAMIEQLRSQPGGRELNIFEQDMVEFSTGSQYQLIYVVWNSFFNILSQDDQVRCLRRVAQHLTATGRFVVEAYVPSYLYRKENNQYVEAESILPQEVKLDVLRHDSATQTIEENHVTIGPSGVHLNPVVQRYAWPSEIDLMAQIAGLTLEHRWGGWTRPPFDSNSPHHVSCYVRRP